MEMMDERDRMVVEKYVRLRCINVRGWMEEIPGNKQGGTVEQFKQASQATHLTLIYSLNRIFILCSFP